MSRGTLPPCLNSNARPGSAVPATSAATPMTTISSNPIASIDVKATFRRTDSTIPR